MRPQNEISHTRTLRDVAKTIYEHSSIICNNKYIVMKHSWSFSNHLHVAVETTGVVHDDVFPLHPFAV